MLQDHRALLIARDAAKYRQLQAAKAKKPRPEPGKALKPGAASTTTPSNTAYNDALRSEEHTSELQSLMRISYAVFCLKKKINNHRHRTQSNSLTTQLTMTT